jgi:soluble lytic murein transglycosylase-like protein
MYNAASYYGISIKLMYAICKVESNCKPHAVNPNDGTAAQKKAGIISKSHGLFQIKLATARGLGFKGKSSELQKPETNSWYAAKYLNELQRRYQGNAIKIISAYNAGCYTSRNKMYVNKVLQQYALYDLTRGR